MSYKILFWPDVRYEPGHWRPVMSMAQKIKGCTEIVGNNNDNNNIRFLCTPECRQIVDRVKIAEIDPLFGNHEIETILPEHFRVGYSSLASEMPEEARSRIDHCQKIADGEFDNMLRSFRPHLLIAGYFVSMEALIIQYRYNKIVRHTLGSNTPELKIMITTTYLRHPAEDPAITSLRFLAHHAQEHSAKLMQAATGDAVYDGSFASIQNFISPLEDVVELITCPQELDHENFQHRENTHYVEPCILDVEPHIQPPKDEELIYASAGSRVLDYVDGARSMFQTLQDMMKTPLATKANRKLEMAVGFALEKDFKDCEEKNITIKNWADQTESLKRAKSAIIHGGLATIKECIYFGIPPVIVPLGKDQTDNALRVVNKEVGVMIMPGALDGDRLYNVIMDAETNSDIRLKTETMQEKFRAYEAAGLSVNFVKNVLGIA